MAKKARLCFTDIDRRYCDKFGHFPDYHYLYLYHEKGYAMEEAGKTVQRNVDSIWREMKAEHEREEAEKKVTASEAFTIITKEDTEQIPF